MLRSRLNAIVLAGATSLGISFVALALALHARVRRVEEHDPAAFRSASRNLESLAAGDLTSRVGTGGERRGRPDDGRAGARRRRHGRGDPLDREGLGGPSASRPMPWPRPASR